MSDANSISALRPESVVRRAEAQLSSELDPARSEVVVLNTSNNNYFGLEDVGGRIWQLIGTPQSIEALVSALVEEFDVEYSTCLADTMQFLLSLLEHELIVVEAA